MNNSSTVHRSKLKTTCLLGVLAIASVAISCINIVFFDHFVRFDGKRKSVVLSRGRNGTEFTETKTKYSNLNGDSMHKAGEFSSSNIKQHAYSFLMAGCDPSKPDTFMGYVYNILVAAYMLSFSGSTSDIVVMVRIAAGSQETKLPPDVEKYFHDSNILIKYLPKPIVDNFYSATMDKFEILDLVQYSRVLFLDSDIMPLCNLDYLFHLSEGPNAVLQQNLVIAWKTEPANGGFFMLKPNHTDYLNIKEIQRNHFLVSKGGQFNEEIGWGHVIKPPDHWSTIGNLKNGTKWSFKGALGCQGLLYYWVKYVKKNVSIINHDKVETWLTEENDGVDGDVKLSRLVSGREIFKRSCHANFPMYNISIRGLDNALRKDFYHFTGRAKPWLFKPPPQIEKSSLPFRKKVRSLWYHILRTINEERNMGININGGLNITYTAQLGAFPTKGQLNEMRKAELRTSI